MFTAKYVKILYSASKIGSYFICNKSGDPARIRVRLRDYACKSTMIDKCILLCRIAAIDQNIFAFHCCVTCTIYYARGGARTFTYKLNLASDIHLKVALKCEMFLDFDGSSPELYNLARLYKMLSKKLSRPAQRLYSAYRAMIWSNLHQGRRTKMAIMRG